MMGFMDKWMDGHLVQCRLVYLHLAQMKIPFLSFKSSEKTVLCSNVRISSCSALNITNTYSSLHMLTLVYSIFSVMQGKPAAIVRFNVILIIPFLLWRDTQDLEGCLMQGNKAVCAIYIH